MAPRRVWLWRNTHPGPNYKSQLEWAAGWGSGAAAFADEVKTTETPQRTSGHNDTQRHLQDPVVPATPPHSTPKNYKSQQAVGCGARP